MNHLKNYVRKLSLWALTSGAWLTLATMALSKGTPRPSTTSSAGVGGSTGTYVFPYFLVVIAITLGMLTICMPSRRREKAKPEDYQERKLV